MRADLRKARGEEGKKGRKERSRCVGLSLSCSLDTGRGFEFRFEREQGIKRGIKMGEAVCRNQLKARGEAAVILVAMGKQNRKEAVGKRESFRLATRRR